MRVYFVAGEASADNHGAALMRALRSLDPDVHFIGRGGPQMQAIAGARFENWIDKSGVLGLWEVIKHYTYFRKQFRATLREIEENKPDAVVLIDYPGFNLRLARVLRRNIDLRSVRPAELQSADSRTAPQAFGAGRAGHSPMFHSKIIYYISPQVWAWNRGRIKRMAQWIDLMLCIFPFEAELYNQSGLRTLFVGHPMIERLRAHKSVALADSAGDKVAAERDPNLMALFPGSRSREVRKIFPILIETARELVRRQPDLRFEVAAASPQLARQMEEILARSTAMGAEREHSGAQDREFLKIRVGETAAIMQRAFAGIVASGSATLEAAYFRLPFVLVYKVSWLTYLAGRLLVRVKYLGMPNVLANKEIVPEFIQHRAQPRALAKAVLRLINERPARDKMASEFDAIISSLGEGGANEKAAKAILEELRGCR